MNKDTLKSVKAGDVILRQGDNGDCAYIIESGRVDISIERPGGKSHSVGTRGPGTMIGEMALVDNAPRTATITALEDCTLRSAEASPSSLTLRQPTRMDAWAITNRATRISARLGRLRRRRRVWKSHRTSSAKPRKPPLTPSAR